MPTTKIEPTKDKPIPYDTTDDVAPTLLEEMAVAGNTAELKEQLGAPLELSEGDAEKQKRLLEAVVKDKKTQNLTNQNTAFAAAAFLRSYGSALALDASQARSAITNKLMEIANCGEAKYELKALELLGKHSDIGLFTERSEITINYKDPAELENAIKERVKRLLNAEVIDITPVGVDLDEELGVFQEEKVELKGVAKDLDWTPEEEKEGQDESGPA